MSCEYKLRNVFFVNKHVVRRGKWGPRTLFKDIYVAGSATYKPPRIWVQLSQFTVTELHRIHKLGVHVKLPQQSSPVGSEVNRVDLKLPH